MATEKCPKCGKELIFNESGECSYCGYAIIPKNSKTNWNEEDLSNTFKNVNYYKNQPEPQDRRNIGEIICVMSKILFWLCLIASALFIFTRPEDMSNLDKFILFLGYVLGDTMISILIYGFGELVCRSISIDEKLKDTE